MAWPTMNMNWVGDQNNYDEHHHTICLAQTQAQQPPQVPTNCYWRRSECARPPSPSTRNAILNSQAMSSTSEYFDWSMLSSTTHADVFSTSFGNPTSNTGPNYFPGTREAFFSHPASISPVGQSMDLAGQTLDGHTGNNEVYHQALATSPPDRVQTTGKWTKKTQQSQDPPLARPIKCKWDDCQYPGTFKQESLLIRHLKNVHVSPGAHPCCVPGCDKVCNRADNLARHMKNVHS